MVFIYLKIPFMQLDITTPKLPEHSCDTHVHVFEPTQFPYAAKRAYTPGRASVAQLMDMHQSLGVGRVVLVQPSVYGTDNACLLDAIERIGQARARGVAVVDLNTVSDDTLDQLHAGGVRGIRLNLHVNSEAGGQAGFAQAQQQVSAAKRLAQWPSWHLQVHASLSVHVALLDTYAAVGLPVVFDHFAGGAVADAHGDALLQPLLQAMHTQPVYVKLSAAYRMSQGCDASALTRAFYQAAPKQVLWGSDWPHTGGAGGQGRKPEAVEPFRDIDNRQALSHITQALGSVAAVQQVLVSNPTHLYGF